MKLTSIFADGGQIPEKYTCEGKNISPPLKILDAPRKARSFVLIVYDPDIPEDLQEKMDISDWTHWILFNIPPETIEIKEGQSAGLNGANTSGKSRYEGPCPPEKQHRYFFTLYALDAKLNLKEGVTREKLEKEMNGHVIEDCQLVGVYEKKENS